MEQNPYQAPQTAVPNAAGTYRQPELKEILFSFEGRVPRRVYWGVTLVATVVFYAITIPLSLISESLGMIAMFALIIPLFWITLAVQIKRWHDRDKSGWWIFIAFIPLVGGIWAFVECGCLRGTFGDNTYGPDPT